MTLSRELRAGLDSSPFPRVARIPQEPSLHGDSDIFPSPTVAPGICAEVSYQHCTPFQEPLASHTYSALSSISFTPLVVLIVPIYSSEDALRGGRGGGGLLCRGGE